MDGGADEQAFDALDPFLSPLMHSNGSYGGEFPRSNRPFGGQRQLA
jgi:hypothetical protein